MISPTVDPSARFAELYRRHDPGVRRCVAGLGLPRHLWPDILQDTWITAHRRLADLAEHPRPDAWLKTVARNHSKHYLRGHLRQQSKVAAATLAPDRCDRAEPHVDRDAWDTLARLLGDCPLEQREVFIKMELHGMTAGEVAEELGISANTVQSRLRLCRQRLRDVAALAVVLLALRTRLDAPSFPDPLDLRVVAPRAPATSLTAKPLLALAASLLLTSTNPADRATDVAAIEHVTATTAEEPPAVVSLQSTRTVPLAAPPAAKALPAADAPLPAPHRTRARPRASAPPAPDLRAPIAPSDDGESLLQAARAAYRGDRPQRALNLALRHRQRFPASELRVSREALLAVIYCRLGRDDDARQQVRTLARDNPNDLVFRAHLRQLRQECR